jgi:hypothetical protein
VSGDPFDCVGNGKVALDPGTALEAVKVETNDGAGEPT